MSFMEICQNLSKDNLNKEKMSWLIMKDTKKKNKILMLKINSNNGLVIIIQLLLETLKIKKFNFLLNLKVEMIA